MTELHKMLIGGKFVAAQSGKTFPVENPATGETIAEIAEAGQADVAEAVEAARKAFEAWGRTTGAERAAILNRAAEILRRRMSEFVEVEVRQTGRPVRELSAQLARLPEWYEYFGAVARTHEASCPPFGGDYLNYTRRVPLGVVAHITPWNHPLLILTKKVAPALAAGNTIVAKPSELAPITPIMLGEVLEEAGLPAGVYNVVNGFGPTTGKALVEHPSIRKIDVTGGTETGRRIAALAGERLIHIGAELGGKASVILFDDTDIEQAVSAAMFAAFIATGQTCVQGSRVVVQRTIHDALLERLVARTEAVRVGDPQNPQTQMGPMISAKQLKTVERYVSIAKEEGATIATGGTRLTGGLYDSGHFFAPTVISDVTNQMRVAQEEIFGPVTCVIPFDDEADALRIANGTPFGLSTSIWTRDLSRGHRVAQSLECGIVWINDHHRIDPASPWGGFKLSGLGRENGIIAYEQYTELQNIIVNLSDEPFDWYTDDRVKRYS